MYATLDAWEPRYRYCYNTGVLLFHATKAAGHPLSRRTSQDRFHKEITTSLISRADYGARVMSTLLTGRGDVSTSEVFSLNVTSEHLASCLSTNLRNRGFSVHLEKFMRCVIGNVGNLYKSSIRDRGVFNPRWTFIFQTWFAIFFFFFLNEKLCKLRCSWYDDIDIIIYYVHMIIWMYKMFNPHWFFLVKNYVNYEVVDRILI